jgi:hypothetical protein
MYLGELAQYHLGRHDRFGEDWHIQLSGIRQNEWAIRSRHMLNLDIGMSGFVCYDVSAYAARLGVMTYPLLVFLQDCQALNFRAYCLREFRSRYLLMAASLP